MMKILLTEPIDLELVADALAERRSSGAPITPRDYSKWHVSNLLNSAREIIRGNNVYHEYQGHPVGIMSFGRIWEEAVDAFMARLIRTRGGFMQSNLVLEEDDIVASLDGVLTLSSPEATMPLETKLRFSQTDMVPETHRRQMCAYCHLLRTTYACYVSGYITSGPPLATATLHMLEFDQSDVEGTWQMILETKKHLESLGIGPAAGGR